MKRFFKNLHLPENLEVLFMLILGILLQMADGSPFSMKERWKLVWETELPASNFNPFVQRIIKTVLSMIVVVRCATTYAYVVSAMLVIFCLLRNTAPKLMLLWLLVAGAKSICMTVIEALTGVYVCSAFGKIRKACIEFFISKSLEIIFATYLWGSVQNIYQDMERKAENKRLLQEKELMHLQKMDLCRQRARSLVDESTLYKTACLNNFEFKDVPQIILQMLRADEEMSQDSLMCPGMMLASVSNLGSFDHLKTSQSLGELGFMDLGSTQVLGMEEDENLSNQEKALRFLKLTKSDVQRIRLNKTSVGNDIYTIDREVWKRMEASGQHINKPKEARTQVFIHYIPQPEHCDEKGKPRKKGFDYKFGFTFSSLFKESPTALDEEQYEEFHFSHDTDKDARGLDDDEEDETTQLFMSNLKNGVILKRNRLGIVLKKMKGNEYADLYRQDFMSVIGPEVFDKACKLPKVTSLTKLYVIAQPKTSMSLPAMSGFSRKMSCRADLTEEISDSSSEELQLVNEEDGSGRERKLSEQTDSTEEENSDSLPQIIYQAKEEPLESDDRKKLESCSDIRKKLESCSDVRTKLDSYSDELSKTTHEDSLQSLGCVESDEARRTKARICYRKRRIIIRRISKRKGRSWCWSTSSDTQSNSKDVEGKPDLEKEKEHTLKKPSEKAKEKKEPEEPISENRESGEQRESEEQREGEEQRESGDNKESGEKGESIENKISPMENTGKEVRFRSFNQQTYFLTELLQKPLLDILATYYDLKKKIHVQKGPSSLSKKQDLEFFNIPGRNYYLRRHSRILQSLDVTSSNAKVWKSKVLKTAEARSRESTVVTIRSVVNIIKRESVLRRLLKYEYARLMKKNREFSNINNEVYLWCINDDPNYEKFNNCAADLRDSSIIMKMKSESSLSRKPYTGIFETYPDKGIEKCSEMVQVPSINMSEAANKDANVEELLREAIQEQEAPVDYRVLVNDPEQESVWSQESDEPISLYYSKAANLASPLFDMKRFIYPDHIHYSYKHVKKKGFDVDINGGFPLLMRENPTMGTPVKMGSSKNPEFEITSRPMDLSFASTNAFAEWQTNDQTDGDAVSHEKHDQKLNCSCSKKERNPSDADLNKNKKTRKTKRSRKNSDRNENHMSLKHDFKKLKSKPYEGNPNGKKYLYSAEDFALIEKLLKMHVQFNSKEFDSMRRERKPTQISSTQLHSNKGRINSTYNPAISLQENRSKTEKKKLESQEERTKDMFARLEREALLQSKNVQKPFGPNRST